MNSIINKPIRGNSETAKQLKQKVDSAIKANQNENAINKFAKFVSDVKSNSFYDKATN